MSKADSVAVFPDTNILLHYPPLKDIDWLSLCNAKSVQVVVCLQVVNELDNKKSDSRLGPRAQRAIKDIRAAINGTQQLRQGVTLTVYNEPIRGSDFGDSLSIDSGDDRIVYLCQKYIQHHPEERIGIATEDFGMELRCTAHGIQSYRLDSALRLMNPEDELTKKYREAITELNAFKNRLPRLSLSLTPPGEESPSPSIFELDNSWEALDIDAKMERIREEYPKQAGMQAYARTTHAIPSVLAGISLESWKSYDRKLDGFFKEFQEYLDRLNIAGDAKCRSVGFGMWLINDGNGMANDIDAILRFPANLYWVAEKGSEDAELLEKELEAPKPPEPPKLFDIGGLSPSLDVMSRMPDIANPFFARLDDWRPSVSVNKQNDETFAVHVQLGKLKHGHNVCLGQFLAVFGSWDNVKPFQVAYTISASDLTEKTEGQIHVIARMKAHSNHE